MGCDLAPSRFTFAEPLTIQQTLFIASDAFVCSALIGSFSPFHPMLMTRKVLAQASSTWFTLGCFEGVWRRFINFERCQSVSFRSRLSHSILMIGADALAALCTTRLLSVQLGTDVLATACAGVLASDFFPRPTTSLFSFSSLHTMAFSLMALHIGRAVADSLLQMAKWPVTDIDPIELGLNHQEDQLESCRRRFCVRTNFHPSYMATRLSVDRDFLWKDTFQAVANIEPSTLRDRMLVVHFAGELGVDVGALSREFMSECGIIIGKHMLRPRQVGDRLLYEPCRTLGCSPEQLEVAGRLLAKSFYEVACAGDASLTVNVPLAKNVWNAIMDKVDDDPLSTLAHIDRQLHLNLKRILDEPLETLGLENQVFFVVDRGDREFRLKPNGENLVVNDENKEQFVNLYCLFVLYRANAASLAALVRGFTSLIPAKDIAVMSWEQCNRILCGEDRVDPHDWQINTLYNPLGAHHDVIVTWFWAFVLSLEQHELRQLLHFCTGSTVVPLGGFAELNPPFVITLSSLPHHHLPMVNVCECELIIPRYRSASQLNGCFRQALEHSRGFGRI